MFENRTDAGQKLGKALAKYRGKGAVVLAIPRGGAEVGYQVARGLDAEFSLVVARKLPFPDNPEAGFGAIAEDGSVHLDRRFVQLFAPGEVERIAREQATEVRRRIRELRGGRPLPDLAGKTVILVDDGIAMGSTMRAAVALCRKAGAARVVVAAPVSGEGTARDFESMADETVILETPRHFRAVAESYRDWYDVPDEEVREVMTRWENDRRLKEP